MTNGAKVRTIDELRANFDLTAVLSYYADGKLVTWLRDRYLDGEADRIEALNKNSKSFQNDLRAALGVEPLTDFDEENGEFDEEYIKRRNEKRRLLRDITDDEKILRMICVNYAEIESKYVGETGKNLMALFEFSKTKMSFCSLTRRMRFSANV